jgi:hypothetical protein
VEFHDVTHDLALHLRIFTELGDGSSHRFAHVIL